MNEWDELHSLRHLLCNMRVFMTTFVQIIDDKLKLLDDYVIEKDRRESERTNITTHSGN